MFRVSKVRAGFAKYAFSETTKCVSKVSKVDPYIYIGVYIYIYTLEVIMYHPTLTLWVTGYQMFIFILVFNHPSGEAVLKTL